VTQGGTLVAAAAPVVAAAAPVVAAAARIVGLAVLGGAVAGAAAAGFRWYARERIPSGLALLLSLAAVALSLNTSSAFRLVGGQRGVFEPEVALVNVLTFGAAALAAPAAAAAGDRTATSVAAASGAREVEGEVGRLVRTVGRVITVELPETVGDIEGYDPVAPDRKAALAGKTLVFPRRLTVGALRERLVGRLKTDYGVGHVDVELTDEGAVEYLAVGSRAAGLGPTLPPRTVALAVRADPALAAGAGDLVQVWRPGDPPERLVTAELRGTAGDVATLAVDQQEADALDDATRYRLVTLPSTPRAGNEFANLLRSADETMAVVTVGADSPLAGRTVRDVGAVVVAVRGEGGIEALPARDRALAAGDAVYAVARPEELRALERAATAGGG